MPLIYNSYLTISKQFTSAYLARFGGKSQNHSFPRPLEPPDYTSLSTKNKTSLYIPTHCADIPQILPGYLSHPRDPQPHHSHQTHPPGTAGSELTEPWAHAAGGTKGRDHLCENMLVTDLALKGGHQGFEARLLQSQNSGFVPVTYP